MTITELKGYLDYILEKHPEVATYSIHIAVEKGTQGIGPKMICDGVSSVLIKVRQDQISTRIDKRESKELLLKRTIHYRETT